MPLYRVGCSPTPQNKNNYVTKNKYTGSIFPKA